ncbi:hypothetical protein [Vibrio harveyi]|uniref:hypothetical protein n=1 Tax=Vibrio harveyi TaxID=669 RepID=UPI003CF5BB05
MSHRLRAIEQVSAYLKLQDLEHKIIQSSCPNVEDDMIELEHSFHISITFEYTIAGLQAYYSLIEENQGKLKFSKPTTSAYSIVVMYQKAINKERVSYSVHVQKFFEIFHIYIKKNGKNYVNFACQTSSRSIAKNIAEHILSELYNVKAFYDSSNVIEIGTFQLRTGNNRYLKNKSNLLQHLEF